MMVQLRSALRLLTIVPLRWDEREAKLTPGRTVGWFPIVGLGIGAVLYATMLMPIPALPRAALCLVVWIIITGGLHEDGAMDCADAAIAPVDAERRAAIRKDPHVGAHGVTTAALLIVARFAALAAVPAPAVLLAPVVGRWSMTITLSRFRPHASSALGAAYSHGAGALPASVTAALIVALLAAWQHEVRLLIAAAAGLLGAFLCVQWLVNRLGGASGDVHGAAGLIAETITLYAMLIRTDVSS